MNSLELLTRNYVDANCGISLSSGTGASYLYDGIPSSRSSSSGSADGTTETIDVEFKDKAGTVVSRTFDRLVLLNINLARFYVQYWSAGAWVTIAESVFGAGSENAEANVYVEMATPVSSTKMRIVATHTIIAGEEKRIGEFKVAALISVVRHVVAIDQSTWSDGDSRRLDNGKLFAWSTVRKLDLSVRMDSVSKTTFDAIIDYLRESGPMVWVFWDDYEPADIYDVRVDPGSLRYSLDRKVRRYSLSMSVKEM